MGKVTFCKCDVCDHGDESDDISNQNKKRTHASNCTCEEDDCDGTFVRDTKYCCGESLMGKHCHCGPIPGRCIDCKIYCMSREEVIAYYEELRAEKK